MKKVKRVRKPKGIPARTSETMYASFFEDGYQWNQKYAIYIGGDSSCGHQQIYIERKDVRKLAAWLLHASAWLEQQEEK